MAPYWGVAVAAFVHCKQSSRNETSAPCGLPRPPLLCATFMHMIPCAPRSLHTSSLTVRLGVRLRSLEVAALAAETGCKILAPAWCGNAIVCWSWGPIW